MGLHKALGGDKHCSDRMLTDASITGRYMNAEKYNLDRIYFGGYFIRGASLVCAQRSLRHRRARAARVVGRNCCRGSC